jgi:hypothetical protein
VNNRHSPAMASTSQELRCRQLPTGLVNLQQNASKMQMAGCQCKDSCWPSLTEQSIVSDAPPAA